MASVEGSSFSVGAEFRRSSIWPPFDSEAERVGAAAVRHLSGAPNETCVTLASELRDSQDLAPFKSEGIFQRVALDAGFELAVLVCTDRKGFIHHLLLRRGRPDGRKTDQAEARESRIRWTSG